MEYDLLFTLIRKADWKAFTSTGVFAPQELEDQGYIRCIQDAQLEDYANSQCEKNEDLLLVVIDPLRIQTPLKEENIDGNTYPNIYGSLSMDAIIDKISLNRNKKGNININVKHFD